MHKSEIVVCAVLAIAIVLGALSAPAHAADGAMPLVAVPLTHARAGTVAGCGIRVTGGSAGLRVGSVWIDISINVYAGGTGIVQAIAYTMPTSRYEEETRPVRRAVQRAWMQPRDAAGSTRLGENTDARDAVVYAVTLDEAARLFEAVAAGHPVVVGVRAWSEPREWRFEGVAELSEAARGDVAKCLGSLVN